MNGKGVRKEYDINNYYYAGVCVVSEPYEGFCRGVGIITLMHHKSEKQNTLLLYKGEQRVDLMNPYRKFYTPRDGEEKCSIVEYEYPLKIYLEALGIDISFYTPKEALKLVTKNFDFFESYTAKLEAEERAKRQEENIRKLQMIPNTTKPNSQKI